MTESRAPLGSLLLFATVEMMPFIHAYCKNFTLTLNQTKSNLSKSKNLFLILKGSDLSAHSHLARWTVPAVIGIYSVWVICPSRVCPSRRTILSWDVFSHNSMFLSITFSALGSSTMVEFSLCGCLHSPWELRSALQQRLNLRNPHHSFQYAQTNTMASYHLRIFTKLDYCKVFYELFPRGPPGQIEQ